MTDNYDEDVLERPTRQPGVFDRAFLTGAKNVTEVLLIRHGQQEYDADGPVGDLIDPPLSEQGRLQARLLGQALSTTTLDAVYTSTLRRARDTAEAVAEHHSLKVDIVPDLREVEVFRDMPPDKTVLEVLGKERLSATRERMLEERSWDVYPYSESSADFRKRAVNAVEACIAKHEGRRIAVVCHGGVINIYTGHIIRSAIDMFFRPAHTSVNIVVAGDGRRVLRLLNDTHHLTTAEGDAVSY
jgi:broad specificity phosphatase PhoE